MIETIHQRNEPPSGGFSISKDEINRLPMEAYTGPIRLVNDREQLDECLEIIAREELLGFDTETRPAFERGVSYPPALMQLATSREVFIFQFHSLGGLGPLRALLENPNIIKAGVALTDDIKQLNACWAFTPKQFVEIGTMARDIGCHQTGLRSLAALLLGFRISKKEQRSNWARPSLTRSQLVYAATDAWVSRLLYLNLLEKWGDRPLPSEVDPLTPDPTLHPRESGNRSRPPRRFRRRGRSEREAGRSPELPGMAAPEPDAPVAPAG